MAIETVNVFSYFIAFGAGVISFLSPCVLPVVPGYLSVITGLDIADADSGNRRQMVGVVRDTSFFIAGFGAVFVSLGLSATSLGSLLVDHQLFLTRLSGVLVLSMALFIIGSMYLEAPFLYQEARFNPELGRFGRAAPGVAGVAFGFGWTPCIGPVLGSILTIAAQTGDAATGATLLGAYSLGLGVPFLVTGLAFSRLAGAFAFVKRHYQALMLGSAGLLAFFGVLLIFNRLIWVTTQLQEFLRSVGLESIVNLG
ncbi:MAG: cytochrome c biogenesis protein CcdA [Acidimicrobiia bacterium]|nr:cytochrome c biogenesis protein CcdA [Acidimicrobiia bacterium]